VWVIKKSRRTSSTSLSRQLWWMSTPNSSFTWFNLREDPSYFRLDKLFVIIHWEDHFPNVESLYLARHTSDPKPILLKTNSRFRKRDSSTSFTMSCQNLVEALRMATLIQKQ